MKKVLMEMEDQKNSYEQKAKESLQKVLEEKMSAEQQLQSTQVRGCCVVLATGGPGRLWESAAQLQGAPGTTLSLALPQRSLALAEQKCEEWRSQYEALKEDWRTLGTRHRELESQLHVLQSKLQVPAPGGGEVEEEAGLRGRRAGDSSDEKSCSWIGGPKGP